MQPFSVPPTHTQTDNRIPALRCDKDVGRKNRRWPQWRRTAQASDFLGILPFGDFQLAIVDAYVLEAGNQIIMQLERTIADIVQKLREGRFPNEQSISQGIVLRILSDLGWDVYDTNIVWPEYSTGEGRVDFALCDPPAKPRCFVEVKQQGKAEDGVKQALEYAFHTGSQFVTLTDGQTWSFYLPAEQGSYEDRRVFKLDLFERTTQESAEILRRYLERERVASGDALETARKEYRNRNRRSAARQAIPESWSEIVERGDEQLVELLTDAVESKVGIRPDENDILNFFSGLVASEPPVYVQPAGTRSVPPRSSSLRTGTGATGPTKTVRRSRSEAAARVYAVVDGAKPPRKGSVLSYVCETIAAAGGKASFETISESVISGGHQGARSGKPVTAKNMTDTVWHGVQSGTLRVVAGKPVNVSSAYKGKPSDSVRSGTGILRGEDFSYGSAKDAMVFVLGELAKSDPSFLQRCSQHPAFRGRKRRHVAQHAADLYPGRPDLSKYHVPLPGGWLVGTNLNNRIKLRIIQGAAEVAGLTFGRDVVVEF